jgi:hypothetical protein
LPRLPTKAPVRASAFQSHLGSILPALFLWAGLAPSGFQSHLGSILPRDVSIGLSRRR